MDYRSDWYALRDRILAVEKAAELFLRGLGIESVDSYAVCRKVFRPQFHGLALGIRTFESLHSPALPSEATRAIRQFLTIHGGMLENEDLEHVGHVVACVTALCGFRAEVEFQIANRGHYMRRVTERAFLHLQRSIVADDDVQNKWSKAFDRGEVATERLGGSHLLLHGVWAFKVSAAGERTDLVLAEPLTNPAVIASASEALVLTEWKLVRDKKEADSQLEAALAQAKRYSQGVLGGIELVESRYLVVVAKQHLDLRQDWQEDDVFFRPRCIAVSPLPPSVAANARRP